MNYLGWRWLDGLTSPVFSGQAAPEAFLYSTAPQPSRSCRPAGLSARPVLLPGSLLLPCPFQPSTLQQGSVLGGCSSSPLLPWALPTHLQSKPGGLLLCIPCHRPPPSPLQQMPVFRVLACGNGAPKMQTAPKLEWAEKMSACSIN